MQVCILDGMKTTEAAASSRSLEDLARESGHERLLLLASNENPLGASLLALLALRAAR